MSRIPSKRCLTVLTASLLAFGSLSQPVLASGIPVVDVANLAQTILQLQEMYKQYKQLESQLKQAKESYDAIVGSRDMGQLLNGRIARDYIPGDFAQLQKMSTDLGNAVGVLQSKALEYKKMAQILKEADLKDPATIDMLKRSQNQIATQLASADETYGTLTRRFSSLQELIGAVDGAKDAKAAADLTNRITSESALIQSEVLRLQAMQIGVDAQRAQNEQRGREYVAKMGRGKVIYADRF